MLASHQNNVISDLLGEMHWLGRRPQNRAIMEFKKTEEIPEEQEPSITTHPSSPVRESDQPENR